MNTNKLRALKQRLRDILLNEGLKNINVDDGNASLVDLLDNDSLVYKRVLREIFFHRMCQHSGKTFSRSDKVKKVIPRVKRMTLVYELESSLNVDFPKMTMSIWRNILMVSIFTLPVFLFFILARNDQNLIGFVAMNMFISTIISWAIFGLIIITSPSFFSALDWENIETIDDLLHDLAIRNSEDYSKDSFKLTIDGVYELLQ